MGNRITAILLAAGQSNRMGRPKLLLPWGRVTVLEQVVSLFSGVGLEEIIVVTGAGRAPIESLVARLAQEHPVRTVHNPEYAHDQMLRSIQTGMAALGAKTDGALIGLGDQPQVRKDTMERICSAFIQNKSLLVIPSFQNRRGHPWLVARPLWEEILALPCATIPRQFLNMHADQMEYVAGDESILQDLDTPEDYASQRP
jgi:molybdenum cofactor cytidylyltransferase